MSRVLLAISYIDKNEASAHETLSRYQEALDREPRNGCTVVLGVETSAALADRLRRFHDRFAEIRVWDDDATRRALSVLGPEDPRPFSETFSYGSFVNKALVMGVLTGCDYLVRVDPGTSPPKDLWQVLEKLVRSRGSFPVTSGRYEGRLAVRTDCYRRADSDREEYLNLVREFTGVDVRDQTTGGALFVSALPGAPAIPFQAWGDGRPCLVWGSDDAIYQLMGDARAPLAGGVLRGGSGRPFIPRHDSVGLPKPVTEYFLGVAGMVHLNSLLHRIESRDRVDEFIRLLNVHLDPEAKENLDGRGRSLVPLAPVEVAPDGFLQRVAEGWREYQRLRENWNRLVELMVRGLAGAGGLRL